MPHYHFNSKTERGQGILVSQGTTVPALSSPINHVDVMSIDFITSSGPAPAVFAAAVTATPHQTGDNSSGEAKREQSDGPGTTSTAQPNGHSNAGTTNCAASNDRAGRQPDNSSASASALAEDADNSNSSAPSISTLVADGHEADSPAASTSGSAKKGRESKSWFASTFAWLYRMWNKKGQQ